MSSKYMSRKTPGVYITEFPAFAPSVVGVATAIPIFVGYTETAKDPSSNKPVYNQAIPISSLADYESYFGGAFDTKYYVNEVAASQQAGGTDYDFQAWNMGLLSSELLIDVGSPTVKVSPPLPSPSNLPTTDLLNYTVSASPPPTSPPTKETVPQFNLYAAMRLFFNNGGGNCYIVAVANYYGKQDVATTTSGSPPTTASPITLSTESSDALLYGLNVAKQAVGPTMVVVPDACLLSYLTDGVATTSAYADVVCEMLNQSASQKDRVAILDLPGAVDSANWNTDGLATTRDYFYDAIASASDSFSYGAAYAPALEVSVQDSSDVDYTNLYGGAGDDGVTYPSILLMNQLLTTQAYQQYKSSKLANVLANVEAAFPSTGVPPAWTGMTSTQIASQINTTNNYLLNALPLLSQVLQIMLEKLNVAPPSGVMAGIWTKNDSTNGVWNAPANMSLASVVGPKVMLSDEDQEDYNIPLNGESIGILRSFPSRGTVVWGARTLDGNSSDYRYIQVRRTLVYVEQSIKAAIQPFVFAANTGQTWATVISMISNFLTGVWSQGGLMGDKASDAFTVQCGLGTTMTSQNILDGYMIVAVTLQMVHPAEFIELTFTQTMQGG